MHRIDTPTAQPDKFGPGKNGFTGGNPQTGQLPTALDQDFFDALQEEIARVVEGAGLELDKQNHGQMLVALGMMFASKDSVDGKQPLADTLTILASLMAGANKLPYFTGNDTAAVTDLTATGRGIIGKNSKDDVLSYLGLGEAAKRNVGSGNNQLPDMGLFSSLLGTSGYQKLPSGLIIQWGASQGSTSGVVTYSFPIPFPNAILAMTGSQGNAQAYARGAAQPLSGNPNSQYQVSAMTGGSSYAADTIRWFAVGY